MTVKEVAEYFRVKPRTIYYLAREKKIPAAKIGKEWRFKKSIIDEWFERRVDEKFSEIIQKGKKK